MFRRGMAASAPTYCEHHLPPSLLLRVAQVLSWAAGRGPLAQPLPFRAFLAFLGTPALPAASCSAAPAVPGSTTAGQHNRPSMSGIAAKAAALAAAALALACLNLHPCALGVLQCERLALSAGAGGQVVSSCPDLPHQHSLTECSAALLACAWSTLSHAATPVPATSPPLGPGVACSAATPPLHRPALLSLQPRFAATPEQAQLCAACQPLLPAALTLLLFTSLGMECAAAVACLLSGMPVVPPFNQPWLSTSLRWTPGQAHSRGPPQPPGRTRVAAAARFALQAALALTTAAHAGGQAGRRGLQGTHTPLPASARPARHPSANFGGAGTSCLETNSAAPCTLPYATGAAPAGAAPAGAAPSLPAAASRSRRPGAARSACALRLRRRGRCTSSRCSTSRVGCQVGGRDRVCRLLGCPQAASAHAICIACAARRRNAYEPQPCAGCPAP